MTYVTFLTEARPCG